MIVPPDLIKVVDEVAKAPIDSFVCYIDDFPFERFLNLVAHII
ncbi:MAG: hypothetical protein ACI8SA_002066 [Dokdonia sp.]|jgi:hypothetical protein